MKKAIAFLLCAAMLVSLIPAAFAQSEVTYIPAPYDVESVDLATTYLIPAVYENEDGPSIGVTTVGVLVVDGKYFKDSNNNKELDTFEDWRIPAEERAVDLVSKLSLKQQAGFVMNGLGTNSVVKTLAEATNEDGTINPAACLDFTTTDVDLASARALSYDLIANWNVLAGVYRGGLGYDASMVALHNNVAAAVSEAVSAKAGLPALPATIISNPISAGFPDSLGMAAAVLGDGNDASAIREYAEVDRQMWIAQGINAMYGPQIDLVSDPRWPRNSGTYGERPETTAAIISALVEGYQMGREGAKPGAVVLAAKHFPGDGASENGFESHSYTGQWRLYPTPGSLENYQLVGFQAAVDAKVGSIMPCYSRDTTDDRSAPQFYRGQEINVKALGSAYNDEIIGKLLRELMGFEGFINSDSGIVTTQTYGVEELSEKERLALLIQAGTDAIGSALRVDLIAEAVEDGTLAKEDLDRANYNRSLAVIKQGRLDNPYLDYAAADEVRATNLVTAAEQAYALHQKAVVMLKNTGNVLPMAAGQKVYVASFTGKGADDNVITALSALFTERGFEVVEKAAEADIAYLYVAPTAANKNGSTSVEGVLSLIEEVEYPERDAANASQAKTGQVVTVTTLEGVKKISSIAETVHGNGGKVVATLVGNAAWIPEALEPHVDALLVNYTTSAVGLASAYSAQMDVMTGVYAPTGKLCITLPACEAVIALTEITLEDGTIREECASPNDVPGYDKDQYIAPEVLAQSPSGSYAYRDSEGNFYVSGFGLTYGG